MKSSTTPRRGDLSRVAACGRLLFSLLRRTTGAVVLPNPYQGGLFLLATLISVLGYAQTTNQPATGEGQKPAYTPDMQKALAYVEQSEYFIRDQRATGALQSPNRAHNMRFTYKPDGFEAQPRVDSSLQWKIAFQVLGVYRGDTRLIAAASEADATVAENRLVYEQAGYQVEYLNNQAGMRQNFIVAEKPAGSEPLTVKMAVESQHLQLACHNNELTGTQGGMVRYYYKDLKVWDARQNPLPATMQLQGNTLALVVDDRTATYPITIDPLSTTAAAQVESDQAGAEMGTSVASAGDVNGDGYSDVIVGAPFYDNGQTAEGAAFVYHGSASGISTTAVALVESNQADALMGWSVASAGDVNGDGYSDVIVGAFLYDNGQINEGAAFVYHGSASGIVTTAAARVESDQAGAQMGWSVASAGDVNGDGYSDVIVGAFLYDNGQINTGAAFVYHGSPSGISTAAAAQVESNQAGAQMGYSVASAGDVNGDGYSDVIVGAELYDNGQDREGAAFVYHGSAAGISTTAAAQVESDQGGAEMGRSVASAGDVNGDGFSDVIVGAYFYSNGQNYEGAAFVYHGSATGISTTAAARVESDQGDAQMGWSVASAGDVNGDGYSDVIVGANQYSNGQNVEGAAFVYHGNAGGGLRHNARAFNTNTTTPIQQSNATANDFSLGLFSKSFLGSTKGKLVWEVKQQGEAFSSAGGSIANSVASTAEQGAFSNLGTSGTQLANAIDKAGTQTKVRVRVRYDPVTAITGQVYGPWQYLPEYTRGAQGMSSTPLLIPPLLTVAGNIKWSTDPNQGVKDATVTISGNAAGSGDSDADGNYSIDLYSGGNLTVTPVKNINKFNGVTAADATRIQQHVTGNPLLGAPYPRIAADVNKNNSISVQDASLIKQALLGNPQANTLWNTSWRFVDADYVFLNPNVPWNFPESIALNGVNSSQTDVNFTGIKLGDVTTPAANPALRPEPLVLRTSDQRLQSGQIMAVPVSVEGFAHVAAFQFVLHFDADALALQHISTPEGSLLSLGDFGTYDAAQGEIRTVFAQPQGAEMTNGDVFFTLHFTPLQSGAWLSEAIHLDATLLPAEAYTPDMEVKPIDLVFSQSSATGQLHDPKPALRAIPNPANDQTRLHFTLPVADEAFIRVINLNGKVLLAQRARYDAGAHVLPMTFTQAGVYMAELRTAKGVEVVKIVVE